MGYTKSWVSDVSLTRSNISSWRLGMQEIHSNLIESGWIWRHDLPDQITDFDELTNATELQGDLSKFRIYQLDDGWGHFGQIYIKICFLYLSLPLGSAAQRVNLIPATHVRVSDSLDFPDSRTARFGYPTSLNQTSSNYSSGYGVSQSPRSAICSNSDLGFYGFFYSESQFTVNSTSYSSFFNPFSLVVQRNLDENLNVTHGFSTYGHIGPSTNSAYTREYKYIRSGHASISEFHVSGVHSDFGARPFSDRHSILPTGVVQVSPVYTDYPSVRQIPTLVSYVDTQIQAGTVFEAETVNGNVFKYIATGESGLHAGYGSNIAMLYQ